MIELTYRKLEEEIIQVSQAGCEIVKSFYLRNKISFNHLTNIGYDLKSEKKTEFNAKSKYIQIDTHML